MKVCANGAFYGFLEGHPLTAFGENIALTLQSLMIILLIWRYTSQPKVSLQEQVIASVVFLVYVICSYIFLPKHLHYVLLSLNWPVLLYSRGSQIMETFSLQHTGAQSIVTNGLNLVGGLIRILTTIQEVGWDMAVLTGFGLSTLLNMVLVSQNIFYRENTEKFIKSLRADAVKKES
jgi:hypothetical protein